MVFASRAMTINPAGKRTIPCDLSHAHSLRFRRGESILSYSVFTRPFDWSDIPASIFCSASGSDGRACGAFDQDVIALRSAASPTVR